MHTWTERTNKETKNIESVLGKEFPETAAYRYNSASIRVRVVDHRFEGLSSARREELVDPLLARLPEATQSKVTILLLLTPKEAESSFMNVEFENPSPTSL